jgi:hypothetical protein
MRYIDFDGQTRTYGPSGEIETFQGHVAILGNEFETPR